MSQYDLSRPVLDQVREAADIVAVVGEHLAHHTAQRSCPVSVDDADVRRPREHRVVKEPLEPLARFLLRQTDQLELNR